MLDAGQGRLLGYLSSAVIGGTVVGCGRCFGQKYINLTAISNVFVIFWQYFSDVLGLIRGRFGNVLGIFLGCVSHVLGMFRYVLSMFPGWLTDVLTYFRDGLRMP